MRYGLLMGYGLFYAGCKPAETDPPKDLSASQVAIVQALNKVILPLRDSDPTRDFAELAPLNSLLAKAQVVGMGEGTHGTREFFRMKDRLFRYLVQQHGHRVIAFEANFGRAVLVNRFIHGQKTNLASAEAAAKSLYFWTWKTAEVRDLIEWMRQYNVNKPASQQVSFYGFDCQFADDEYPLITDFVAKVAPDSVDRINSLYLGDGPAAGVSAIYRLFVDNETKWVTAGGRTEYEIARQAVRVLIQQQDLSRNGSCQRDKYMAENVQWLLTTLKINKVSLWAHDHHIANWSSYCDLPMMGAFLKKQLDNKYVTVGTSLSSGSFNAVDVSTAQKGPGPVSVRTEAANGSFNHLLSKAQYAGFALNLAQARPDSALTNWLSRPRPLFEVGAGYDESRPERYYLVTPLTGRYDILIHFRDTTPTQLLP